MDACRLVIGADASWFSMPDSDPGSAGPPAEVRWSIGSADVCPGPLRATPPTELEIERAIETVEDQIMPTLAPLLHGKDRTKRLRVATVGHPLPASVHGVELSIEAIELAFSALASSASARRDLGTGGWSEPSAAAILIIVREAMHHGGFAQVLFEAAHG